MCKQDLTEWVFQLFLLNISPFYISLVFTHLLVFQFTSLPSYVASPVAQTVKNLPAMLETWAQSLGQEGLLEEGMATHSSIPALMALVGIPPLMPRLARSYLTSCSAHTHKV